LAGFGDDFLADAVAGNDGDASGLGSGFRGHFAFSET
jgi:hypothetical protein